MINLLYDTPASLLPLFYHIQHGYMSLVSGCLLENYQRLWCDISKGHPPLGYQLLRKEAWAIVTQPRWHCWDATQQKEEAANQWQMGQVHPDISKPTSKCETHDTLVGDHSGSSAACILPDSLLAYSLTSGLRQNHEGVTTPLCLLSFLSMPFPSAIWNPPTKTKYIILGAKCKMKMQCSSFKNCWRISRWWQQSLRHSPGMGRGRGRRGQRVGRRGICNTFNIKI